MVGRRLFGSSNSNVRVGAPHITPPPTASYSRQDGTESSIAQRVRETLEDSSGEVAIRPPSECLPSNSRHFLSLNCCSCAGFWALKDERSSLSSFVNGLGSVFFLCLVVVNMHLNFLPKVYYFLFLSTCKTKKFVEKP